jgi:hypothetical protein
MKMFNATRLYAKLILLGLLTAVFLLVSCAPAATEPATQSATIPEKPAFVFDRTPADVDAHTIEYYMSPTCGCCGYHADAFAEFSEEIGYDLHILMHDSSELYPIKAAAGVPTQFYSCHTAFADGYFLEGHVPVSAANWLLTEKPEGVAGIATRHGNGETNPDTWLGEAYYIVYEDGVIEGPFTAVE